MKRFISLLLAILMLTGLAVLFASCKNEMDGNVELSGGIEELDLTDYALIYGESQSGNEYTTTFQARLEDFSKALSAKTGEKFTARTAARSDKQPKEILVGATDREESRKALAQISGDGFAIRVIGEKIAIVGTDNVFTLMALHYFEEKYLGGEKTATLALYESAVAKNVACVVLADEAQKTQEAIKNAYTYVYRHGLGSLPSAYAATGSDLASSTYKEYEQAAIETIVKNIQEKTDLANKYFPTGTDKKEYEREVLIGRTDRKESVDALAAIAENEYIIRVAGERVVVNAWSEATLRTAVSAYIDLLAEGAQKDADGKTVIRLPQGFCLIAESDREWELDFPKPEGEGISLYNTMDANDGALQFLYTGDGVNAESYRAYCNKLKAAGYTVYMENEAEDSIFTTFVNKAEKIALYVAYNAYAHKDEFEEFKWALSHSKTGDKNVYQYDPCFRIVSAPLSTAYLPAEELLTPQSYKKETDSKVTAIPLFSGAVGLSYIITLEDGSFVVFDGGNQTSDGAEHDALWRALCKLHKDIYKSEPTQEKPVRIAAWVLTHAHGDHYKVFKKLGGAYGSTGLLKVDYMIANIPATTSVYTFSGIAKAMTPEHIKTLQSTFKGGFEYIKVHTGQKFYIANLGIEVITTWEDHNPQVVNNTNETNTVLRFTLTNQDEPSAKVTQMWTGDANRWQSRFMCATYGEYLKSDMVSVAHHGNNGCEVDFYTMVSPTAVWWPHNAASVANYLNPARKDKDFRHQTDQYLCYELESVKYIYTSGVKVKSDKYYTTLNLTVNGPDYENIYDLMTGEKLTYENGLDGACIKK